MKSLRRYLLAILGTGLVSATLGWAHDASLRTLVTVKIEGPEAVRKIVGAGFKVIGVDYEFGRAQILITSEDTANELHKAGLRVVEQTPVDPKLAPDEGYHTYDEVVEALQLYASAYPALTQLETIGTSVDGREILALKISDNAADEEADEPNVLFNAMYHAREVMTTEVALDIIETLLSNYETDPAVSNWVNDNQIWVVPMLNPDGNHKVWTVDSWWRKNTRDNTGVDLNRNYPYQWNACNGSSGDPSSDTYRGPTPASEPETQALMALVNRLKPVFNISYHSFSELVIYPYGCDRQHTESEGVVENVGQELANLLVRDSGNGRYKPGTSWELLYAVDGGDIDWMYHDHGVIPYVIEVGGMSQGFQPPYEWRDPTVAKQRPGWRYLLDRLAGSALKGRIIGGLQGPATIEVTSLANGKKTLRQSLAGNGAFHVILPPGMYRAHLRLGGRNLLKSFVIGAKPVDWQIHL